MLMSDLKSKSLGIGDKKFIFKMILTHTQVENHCFKKLNKMGPAAV
jgi:hypothetical protein